MTAKLKYLANGGNKMEIRKLNSSDVEDYVRLRLEALRQNPEAFATTYEETVSIGHEALMLKTAKRLDSQETFTIGAFVDEQLVGVVTFMREQKTKLRHKGNVVAMYVTPSERGKGIGKCLLEELIERAKKLNGLEQLHLTVVANNEAAVQLYRSLDFEVYGTERNAMKFEGQYWDEWLMVRFLT
jgi:RimJ/RimL family protein N-acetyltransferase